MWALLIVGCGCAFSWFENAMAHSVDHQPSCPGRRVIGYRCFGCRCRSSYSQQRSVPSHDADPDRCRNSHLVPRASTTQTRLRHSQNQNVYGTDRSHCSASVILAKGPRAPSVRDAVRGYPYLLVVAQSKWQRPIICLPFVGNPSLARIMEGLPVIRPNRAGRRFDGASRNRLYKACASKSLGIPTSGSSARKRRFIVKRERVLHD